MPEQMTRAAACAYMDAKGPEQVFPYIVVYRKGEETLRSQRTSLEAAQEFAYLVDGYVFHRHVTYECISRERP